MYSNKATLPDPREHSSILINDGKDRAMDFSPLQKIRSTELLPELFGLLLDIEQGLMQAKDFDNNLGTTRLKVVTLLERLQDLDDICDSIRDQKIRILRLKESKRAKKELVCELRKAVLLKFDQES